MKIEFNEKVMPRYTPLKVKRVHPDFINKGVEKKKVLKETLILGTNREFLELGESCADLLVPEIYEVCRLLCVDKKSVLNNNFEGTKVSKLLSKHKEPEYVRSVFERVATLRNRILISFDPVDFFTINDTAPFKSCYSIGHTFHRSVACLWNDSSTFLVANVNPEGKTVGKMWFHYYPEYDTAYAGVRKYGYVPKFIIENVLSRLIPKGDFTLNPLPQWDVLSHNKDGKHIDRPYMAINFNPDIVGKIKYAPSLCVSCGKEYEYRYGVDDSRFAVCKDCWNFEICSICGEKIPCNCQK